MTVQSLANFVNFRNSLLELFVKRPHTTLALIDALAGQVHAPSPVHISLNPLFGGRHYSNITAVLHDFQTRKGTENDERKKSTENHYELTALICSSLCSKPVKRKFHLFAGDCTSVPKVHSDKLEDRTFVYQPNAITSNKPVTIGHKQSLIVYLPERDETDQRQVIPLNCQRVMSDANAELVGCGQINQAMKHEKFQNVLSVVVLDTAYSAHQCIQTLSSNENLVTISRLRGNRKLMRQVQPIQEDEKKKRGRPKKYEGAFSLKNPECEPDDSQSFLRHTKKSIPFTVKARRWNDVLVVGKGGVTEPVDVVEITTFKNQAEPLHKKPMFLQISGKRRLELTIEEIFDSYIERFNIEHCFRFMKRNLLATSYQSPEVRHEENWWWVCLLSYVMLHFARPFSEDYPLRWERPRLGLGSHDGEISNGQPKVEQIDDISCDRQMNFTAFWCPPEDNKTRYHIKTIFSLCAAAKHITTVTLLDKRQEGMLVNMTCPGRRRCNQVADCINSCTISPTIWLGCISTPLLSQCSEMASDVIGDVTNLEKIVENPSITIARQWNTAAMLIVIAWFGAYIILFIFIWRGGTTKFLLLGWCRGFNEVLPYGYHALGCQNVNYPQIPMDFPISTQEDSTSQCCDQLCQIEVCQENALQSIEREVELVPPFEHYSLLDNQHAEHLKNRLSEFSSDLLSSGRCTEGTGRLEQILKVYTCNMSSISFFRFSRFEAGYRPLSTGNHTCRTTQSDPPKRKPPPIARVQRGYNDLIGRLNLQMPLPKPRGRPNGRQIGTKMPPREDQPVIRKGSEEERQEHTA